MYGTYDTCVILVAVILMCWWVVVGVSRAVIFVTMILLGVVLV